MLNFTKIYIIYIIEMFVRHVVLYSLLVTQFIVAQGEFAKYTQQTCSADLFCC